MPGRRSRAVRTTAVSFWLSCQAAFAAKADEHTLDRLRLFVFPLEIDAEARTRAFDFRDAGYAFKSLEEVNDYNVRGAHSIPGTAYVLQLDHAPLESPHRAQLRAGSHSAAFIDTVDEILSASPGRPPERRQPDVIEKLLAQRDLYQTYGLLVLARQHADEAHRSIAERALTKLAKLIEAKLFGLHEYRALLLARPRKLQENFTSELRYVMSDNYLPLAVLAEDKSWLRLSNRGEPFRHFTHFRGRSFVKVYIRAAGTSPDQLKKLRESMFDRYGSNLHLMAVSEEVPAGMETMLVRTMGVLLTDGTYRDSSWPEEVIIRAFKYPRATLDLTTSDFRGTMLYQYKLSRKLLQKHRASLGLVRISEDDEQYFGFLGDVPDPRNSYSNATTTMRENCIACHSELFYGLNTIFSLERDPQQELLGDSNEIWHEVGDGRYELRTLEYQDLKTRIHGASVAAK